ncbi:MAG: aspartate aminotransferase family protein [Nitrososphaerota archaeon]
MGLVMVSDRFPRSMMLFEEANSYVAGGVHSNFRYREPHPIYFSRARGSRIWDVDGNEYIDCVVNMGACILGHGYSRVVDAVKDALDYGLTVGLEPDIGVEVAKQISHMIPSAESVRFSNTGTEAVMHAIHIARGFTGRYKIAKLEGGYNGWYDYVLVSNHPPVDKAGPADEPVPVPGSAGLARDVAENVVIIPFNNIDATEKIISKHGHELAAVIIEPVMFNAGCILPRKGYLESLRKISREHGIVLIFDEVITGFRSAPGGAQEYFGVTPDISVFGKAIANGFALSAVVGKKEVMESVHPKRGRVAYAGTYNSNYISLAAARVVLEELKDGKVQNYLHEAGARLAKMFGEAAEELGVKARLQHFAGKFQVYFTDREVIDYRSALACDSRRYSVFHESMLNSGIYMLPFHTIHHGVTFAHTEHDLETIFSAMRRALKEVKDRFTS